MRMQGRPELRCLDNVCEACPSTVGAFKTKSISIFVSFFRRESDRAGERRWDLRCLAVKTRNGMNGMVKVREFREEARIGEGKRWNVIGGA